MPDNCNHSEKDGFRLELKRVRRVLAVPLATGGGRVIRERPGVLLRATPALPQTQTQPLPHGYGEAATLPWFGTESDDAAFTALAELGGYLRRKDAAAALNALGNATPCARWALECALAQLGWSAADNGHLQNDFLPAVVLPVAALLPATTAGKTSSAPAPDGNHSACRPAASAPDATLAALQAALGNGFTTFKLKIGIGSFERELQAVRALLDCLRRTACESGAAHSVEPHRDSTKHATHPLQLRDNSAKRTTELHGGNASHEKPLLKLRLDANGSLDAATLAQWLDATGKDAAFIDFIEQPLAVGKEAQTAALFAGKNIAFALDESLTTFATLREAAARWPQAVLVVKPSLLGDRAGFINWRNSAANRNRRLVYSTALETGIGLYHALRLAALDPQAGKEAAGFGTGNLFADDALGRPPAEAFLRIHPGEGWVADTEGDSNGGEQQRSATSANAAQTEHCGHAGQAAPLRRNGNAHPKAHSGRSGSDCTKARSDGSGNASKQPALHGITPPEAVWKRA